MHIVIVGAGAVGSYLAERLAYEGQDVTVIESDPAIAEQVQSTVDCLVVRGNGASPSVLEDAGIKTAELLIAVSNSDAVNVLACHAAARLGVPRKIARVEDPALRDELENLGVDFVIDPGELLAHELLLLVRESGPSQVIEFADGELVLIGGYVKAQSPMAGKTLAQLRLAFKEYWEWLVPVLVRNGESIVGRGDTMVEPDDHVLVMTPGVHRHDAANLIGIRERHTEKAIILGATRSAQLTASLFVENGINTVLIDQEARLCRAVAEFDDRVVVVQGDPTDPKVLQSEDVANADVLIGMTGWDEVNILGCLLGKSLGVPETVARVQRFEFLQLLPGLGIDAAVSSRLAAANAILRFVRRGTIHSVVTFQDTDAEAIELEIGPTSKAVGKNLHDVGLSEKAIVAGVIRTGETFVPRGATVLNAGDRLIVFVFPEAIPAVESLFE
jgi:trk system potassium uptake protein TrkA